MNEELLLTSRTTNVPKAVEDIIKGYQKRPAKGLVHGFQKDSIQNSWGARLTKKGKDWRFEIRYVENEKGKFLVAEDFGSVGLTGKNYTQDEIAVISDFNENDRLARFSSMNNSGGVTTGAGNFGRGKRMYQAVSSEYKYFFDSQTVENNYYANVVTGQDKTLPKAKEGAEAINFIYEQTGFSKKEGTGTRVIICNPKKEVLDGIKNKEIIEAINETWWPIILKFGSSIMIYYKEELVGVGEVPHLYKKYFDNKDYFYKYEISNYVVKDEYKIKKLEFYLVEESDEIPDDLKNISYYRQDMKIGDVLDIYELPIEDKYKNRLFGYIEFEHDGFWENELKENEDLEHYGILLRKKINYQLMKKTLNDHLAKFCSDKGLKKDNKDLEQNKRLKELARNFTKFLYNEANDFEWSFSKGQNLGKTIILTCNKAYPEEPCREIRYGQEMKYSFSIQNNNLKYKNFKYTVTSYNKDTAEIKVLEKGNIYTETNVYNCPEKSINYDELIHNCRNVISIKVESIDDKSLYDNTSFPLFVDIPEDKEVGDFDLDIEYDKDIINEVMHVDDILKYNDFTIYNNTGYNGTIGLSVTIQDTTQRNLEIESVFTDNNIIIDKYSKVNVKLPDITFGEKYKDRKGKLRIRYAIVNVRGIDIVEEYDKIIEKFDNFYFEEEKEKNSDSMPFDVATTPFDDDQILLKSRLQNESINKYKLIFNSRYPLWDSINKSDSTPAQSLLYDLYSTEEMIKTMIQIQLKQLNYKVIDCEEGEDYSPDIIQQKIDIKVNEYLGKYLKGDKNERNINKK